MEGDLCDWQAKHNKASIGMQPFVQLADLQKMYYWQKKNCKHLYIKKEYRHKYIQHRYYYYWNDYIFQGTEVNDMGVSWLCTQCTDCQTAAEIKKHTSNIQPLGVQSSLFYLNFLFLAPAEGLNSDGHYSNPTGQKSNLYLTWPNISDYCNKKNILLSKIKFSDFMKFFTYDILFLNR